MRAPQLTQPASPGRLGRRDSIILQPAGLSRLLWPRRGEASPSPPSWVGGHDREAAFRGPPSVRAWGRGKLRAKTPLLVPKVGHPAMYREGREAGGHELLLARVQWEPHSSPPCPPPSEKKGWTHSPA